jgi:hypothetical protein
MKETLQIINQMVVDGVIDDYVIGGAIAATYYVEPINTSDVDIQAMKIAFHGVPTKIMPAVHLMAIMVQTSRPKDYARLLQFIEASVVDVSALELVLARHGLSDKWKDFLRKFDVILKKPQP